MRYVKLPLLVSLVISAILSFLIAVSAEALTPSRRLATGTEIYNFANFPWGRYYNTTQGRFIQTYGSRLKQ